MNILGNNNTTELSFLLELSMILIKEQNFSEISKKLDFLFSKSLNITKTKIYLKEEQILLLKMLETKKNEIIKKYENQFEVLNVSDINYSFILNNTIFSLTLDQTNFLKNITNTLKLQNNCIQVPLFEKFRLLGFIEVEFDSIDSQISIYNFFLSLTIAAHQITALITNIILNNQMQANIKFHSAMKNIAKIIESQYEFAYIVPLIGEMIDRFVPEHLIYVFIKNENKKFDLVWPSFCRDKDIEKMLEKSDFKDDYELANNAKIGIFPLKTEDKLIGAIVAASLSSRLLETEINYIVQLTKQSSITIQKAEMYAEVLKHAALDALTGLNNRRQLEVRLSQEIATAKRQQKQLCCIMLDVDFFKKINDSYGHVAGDCILKGLAKLITNELREYDIPSRYGGEEFCILLPSTSLKEAVLVANRLRKSVENTAFNIEEAKIENVKTLNITISLGVGSYKDNDSPIDLYKKADNALYDAKHAGRNVVKIFNEE